MSIDRIPLHDRLIHITFRDTTRGVAARHGLLASFAPKPFADQVGSGAHLHFSAWDAATDVNLFYDANGRFGLSRLACQFLAGVLDHLPALVALSATSVNSYRRLQPRHWSSAYVSYGPDNREAAVRIASEFRGREMESANLELKPSDASCNPYLALGGVIACGLDGIAKELELGEPALQDPDTLAPQERQRLGMHRLPQSLQQAAAALEADDTLKEALGPALHREYLIVKRAEWDALCDKDAQAEIAAHFYKY